MSRDSNSFQDRELRGFRKDAVQIAFLSRFG
jgi:hypothetical protein